MTALKHISSFILPITVLGIIPYYIEPIKVLLFDVQGIAGGIVALAGLTIMVLTISAFARIGKGTLAPWAPTKKLVIVGLYRYMRNPMITGVLLVLVGEALVLHSKNISYWALAFAVINTIFFIIYEEPDLEKRFGEDYREYKRNVNRWLPRLKPFDPKWRGDKDQQMTDDQQRSTNS